MKSAPLTDPLELLQRLPESEVPSGVEERVLARVTQTLTAAALLPPPVFGPDAGSMGPAASTASIGSTAPAAAGSASSSALAAALHSPRLLWYLSTFALGGLAGVSGYAVLVPPRERVVYVDRVIERAVERPPASANATDTPPVEPRASGTPNTPPAEARPRASAVDSAPRPAPVPQLTRERAVLDRARAQMGAGEPAASLELLEEHERTFPRGLLIEEREAMIINALVSLGRHAEARARADSFRQRFPNSLVMPSVNAAIRAIPEN
jgi:hypothetical protein